MCKKISFILLISFLLSSIGFMTYAAPVHIDSTYFEREELQSTKLQSIFTMTRPNVREKIQESTLSRVYMMCGMGEYDDVRVRVLIYDSELEKYKDLKDQDTSKSIFDLGTSGLFLKEFKLNNGKDNYKNKIRIVATRRSQPSVFQISHFVINVLDEDISDKIKNKLGNNIFTDASKNN